MKKLWVAFIVLFIPFGAQAGSLISRGVTDPLGINGLTPPSGTLTITGQTVINSAAGSDSILEYQDDAVQRF
ncbi:hypothetical protein LCGC14_2656650, partial [marine sediment metagenome]